MDEQNTSAFSMIADIEGDLNSLMDDNTPTEVPILPVRNIVLFPGVVAPIIIARESSMKLVRKAEKQNALIGIVCQKDPDIEMPVEGDLHDCGVYAKVLKQLTLPNGMVTVIVQGMGRLKLLKINSEFPDTLMLTEQGKFMIGYYHQVQAFFDKNNKEEN